MTEPTPGPWTWEYSDLELTRPIALTGPEGYLDVLTVCEDAVGPRAYATAANMALIAAAPDLLAACEAVLDRLDYLRGLWGDEAITRRLGDQIRAAVTATRGRVP